MLTLGSGTFGAILSSARKSDEDPLDSAYAKLAAAFTHFIFCQLTAIILAVTAKGYFKIPSPSWAPWLGGTLVQRTVWGIGWFTCIYALCLTIALTHWIFATVKSVIILQKREFAALKKKLNAKAGLPSGAAIPASEPKHLEAGK